MAAEALNKTSNSVDIIFEISNTHKVMTQTDSPTILKGGLLETMKRREMSTC